LRTTDLEAVDLDPDSAEGAAERAGWMTKMLDAFGGVVGRLLSAESEYGSVIGAGENHPDWPDDAGVLVDVVDQQRRGGGFAVVHAGADGASACCSGEGWFEVPSPR
jgi:hypothetical protein